MKMKTLSMLAILLTTWLLSACSSEEAQETAEQFVERVNQEFIDIGKEAEIAAWVRSTYITADTGYLATKASEKYLAFTSRIVQEAKRYNGQVLAPATARAVQLIKQGSSMPAPSDASKQQRLAALNTEMEGMYGAGKYCKADDNGEEMCQDLQELSKTIAKSRNYDELLEAWTGWRTISKPMRPMYEEFAKIMNEGAVEMGFDDTGHLWKSGYDMPVAEFEQETERLWSQVEPLYEELHCYVGAKLADHYGSDKVSAGKPLPAHLFGNMWAQQWGEIYDLLEPYEGVLDLDVTAGLESNNHNPKSITKMAEGFFTSLGLPALPDSFYKNSLLKKPRDRDVVCHASAWDMDNGNDPRIKQCIEPTEEELTTVHHELGHIYYYIMYKEQAPIFKGGAHDGFHEAIGDTVVLSMTPAYLKKMGLIDEDKLSPKAVINQQLKMALDKIAFLPFGKLIDQWRWKLFSGEITPENYNSAWWELREKYQGITAPVTRTEEDFDPGAKYHIPGNTPYTRYFLAHIMQFQFHKSLCQASGHEGPLHECSIFGSKEAGKRLGDMLALGSSQPWPDAMEKITGQREMDASAIIDYFAPLMSWLQDQNQGRSCGWQG